MFYNHDILSRRKTGLGIVWLAATLGHRSVIRRFTRKDILNVNVSKVCEYVLHPTEPLALRLSSQLMYGVVKLYDHQAELLYQDVSHVTHDVRRRILAGGTTALTTKDIDMRKSMRSVEAITLPLDLAFFTLDFDGVTAGLMYRLSVEPPESRAMVEETLGDGFRTPTPMPFTAEERRITLPGRTFEEDDLGLPRGFGEGEDFGPAFSEGGYDEDEGEGLDLGLDIEPAGRPSFIPGASEDIEGRNLGDDTVDTIGPRVEWPELEERLAEEAARMELGPIIDGVPTLTPARRPRDEEAADLEAFLAPTARRPRPIPRPFEDPETVLSDEQMRAARADYPIRMAAHRLGQQARREAREAVAVVQQAMFGPPEDLSLHPMLADMWQMTVGEHLLSRRARLGQLRAEAVLSPMDEDAPVPPPPTPMELDEEEVGVARAAAGPEIPAALRGARESLPWNVFMEHRRRSSMMPSISYERTLDRDTTPLRLREVSVETPTGLRRLPGESPLFPPASPSTAAPFDDYQPPLSLPGTPSVEGFRLGLPTAPARAERSPTPPSQIFEEDVEEETRNFYEYARSIRQELEDPSFLFFSDLAPVASSTPAVAAQAFYHTLALATRGNFKVEQDEPYQQIRINLVGG